MNHGEERYDKVTLGSVVVDWRPSHRAGGEERRRLGGWGRSLPGEGLQQAPPPDWHGNVIEPRRRLHQPDHLLSSPRSL